MIGDIYHLDLRVWLPFLSAQKKEKNMTGKITIACVVGFFLFGAGTAAVQDLSSYESLKTPRMTTMARQRMLVVEAKGDPNMAAKDAFGLLFKTFFSLKGVRMTAPRARWMNTATDPKDQWIGLYGLPLPGSVTGLPEGTQGARIEEWDYGEVAEILHIGPYSEETPTIKKLHAFISEMGYEIAGPHEEEYLKGPGMAASPADYWTIIRYSVKKK
jgi:hypothetical protein